MLKKFRIKRLVFVGNSVNRNNWPHNLINGGSSRLILIDVHTSKEFLFVCASRSPSTFISHW